MATMPPFDGGPHVLAQPVFLLVDALHAPADEAVKNGHRSLDALLVEFPPEHREAITSGLLEMAAKGHGAGKQVIAGRHHQLSGGGRRRGPQIGDEIRDGYVGFVADCGNYGNRAGGDSSRHPFLVECPEILQRTSATRQDHQLRPPRLAEKLETAAYLFHRALALHQRRKHADVQAWKTALQNLQHVRNYGAARGRYNADAPGKPRHRPLARGVKQSLGGQLLFELLEGKLQRAVTLRLQKLDQ